MHFVVVLSFFSSLILTLRVPIIPFFPSPYISGVCQKNKSWCKLFWCRSITLVLMFALFSFYTSYIIKLLLKCVFFSFFLLCPSSTNLHHSSHLSPSRSHQPTCWHCFPFFTGPHFTSCPELILVIWRLHLLCACVCSWKGHQGSEWECECYHKEAKLKRGNCTGLFQADFEKELMLALRSDFTDSNVPGG